MDINFREYDGALVLQNVDIKGKNYDLVIKQWDAGRQIVRFNGDPRLKSSVEKIQEIAAKVFGELENPAQKLTYDRATGQDVRLEPIYHLLQGPKNGGLYIRSDVDGVLVSPKPLPNSHPLANPPKLIVPPVTETLLQKQPMLSDGLTYQALREFSLHPNDDVKLQKIYDDYKSLLNHPEDPNPQLEYLRQWLMNTYRAIKDHYNNHKQAAECLVRFIKVPDETTFLENYLQEKINQN
jgi:hypothetical protein